MWKRIVTVSCLAQTVTPDRTRGSPRGLEQTIGQKPDTSRTSDDAGERASIEANSPGAFLPRGFVCQYSEFCRSLCPAEISSFKQQSRSSAGHAGRNELAQVLRACALVEQSVSNECDEILNLAFYQVGRIRY